MDNVIISEDIQRQPGRQATKSRLQESMKSESDLKEAIKAINNSKRDKAVNQIKSKVIEVSDADLYSESD